MYMERKDVLNQCPQMPNPNVSACDVKQTNVTKMQLDNTNNLQNSTIPPEELVET